MDGDGQPLWPRSAQSRLWLRRKLHQRKGVADGKNPLDTLFEQQKLVLQAVLRGLRFLALCCGRRSGKTELAVRFLAWCLLHDPAGSEMLYCATTAESARRIFWRPLRRLNDELGLGLKFDESKWTVTGPTGNVLSVHGTETVRDLERQRGAKFRRIIIDECGAIRPSTLTLLIQDILEPTMMDYADSTMWLLGTPGPAPAGLWWKIATGQNPAFKAFRWTAKDNPHIADYDGFIKATLERWAWTPDSPKFRREYLAEWASDPARIVFRFERGRSVIEQLPQLGAGDNWRIIVGLDFGVGDATACVVLAYPRRYGRAVYVVDSWQRVGMAPSDAAELIKETLERWRAFGEIESLIGDTGGLGKAYWAEWNRRFPGIEMRNANKQDKRGTVEHLSDALYTTSAGADVYTGRGILSLPENEDLHSQLATLLWDEDRKDIQEGQDDDLSDALMYAWKSSPAFLNATAEPPPPVAVRGTTWAHMPPRAEPAPLAKAFAGAFRRPQK